MKTRYSILSMAFVFLFTLACKKQEVFQKADKNIVKLEIRGYIMTADTLNFLNDKDSIIATGIGNGFTMMQNLFNANTEIRVLSTAKGIIGNFQITPSPFSQVKKILYDGTTITSNIEITPVSNPGKAGYRVSFTAPVDFGGKVDLQIYDRSGSTYLPSLLVQNVGGGFSDFIELPALEAGHTYAFKVYKPGTTDLPYTNSADVDIPNPATAYGTFPFTAGTSILLSISPRMRNGRVSNLFTVSDLTPIFQ